MGARAQALIPNPSPGDSVPSARAMERAGGGKRRWNRVVVSAGLFVLAVAVRALPWRTVLTPEGVVPSSWDAFYHLRRIAWSVVRSTAQEKDAPANTLW